MASLVRPWIVRYVDRAGRQVPKGTPGARKKKERAAAALGSPPYFRVCFGNSSENEASSRGSI